MKDRYSGIQARPSRKIGCWQRGEEWLLQEKAVAWNKAKIWGSTRYGLILANPRCPWNIVHAEEQWRQRWEAGCGHAWKVFNTWQRHSFCWPKDCERVNRTVIWEDGSRTRSKLIVGTPEKMQVGDNKKPQLEWLERRRAGRQRFNNRSW